MQLALNSLFAAENQLRYMLGLSVSDGRLIRPADEPTTAKVSFEWRDIHCEALARSVELRRQKWRIKQRELELIAARNQLLPRLDVNGIYRFVGLGQDLYNNNPTSINGPNYLIGTSSLGVLGSGQFQEWQLGANFAMPLGFRKELAQIRYYELNLAREKTRLQDFELEVSNEVAAAVCAPRIQLRGGSDNLQSPRGCREAGRGRASRVRRGNGDFGPAAHGPTGPGRSRRFLFSVADRLRQKHCQSSLSQRLPAGI